MQCEMCGKETDLFKCLIEGSEMNVCSNCSKFGNEIKEHSLNFKTKESKVINFNVKSNYSNLIKTKREKLQLKQEDVAKSLGVKESIIHKVESGNMEPSIDLAKKFERFFGIELIEKEGNEVVLESSFESKSLTIGDLLKPKR